VKDNKWSSTGSLNDVLVGPRRRHKFPLILKVHGILIVSPGIQLFAGVLGVGGSVDTKLDRAKPAGTQQFADAEPSELLSVTGV